MASTSAASCSSFCAIARFTELKASGRLRVMVGNRPIDRKQRGVGARHLKRSRVGRRGRAFKAGTGQVTIPAKSARFAAVAGQGKRACAASNRDANNAAILWGTAASRPAIRRASTEIGVEETTWVIPVPFDWTCGRVWPMSAGSVVVAGAGHAGSSLRCRCGRTALPSAFCSSMTRAICLTSAAAVEGVSEGHRRSGNPELSPGKILHDQKIELVTDRGAAIDRPRAS